MTYKLQVIIKLLNEGFGLEELNDLCFLYFRPVYEQFQETDRKPSRIRRLVEHVERTQKFDELLAYIEEANPGKYNQYVAQLGQSKTPSSQSASPPAPSGGSVFNQGGQSIGGNQYNVAGDLHIGSDKSD